MISPVVKNSSNEPSLTSSKVATTRSPRSVLVTGASGQIGSHFAQCTSGRYRLRLMVRPGDPAGPRMASLGEIHEGTLEDLDGLKRACAGIDTVVHLAASPDPSAVWDDLLRDNIIGAYHVYVAAKSAGCRRVVFASSIHAVSGGPADVQVKTSDAVNPGDLYGVTKCFGEALGRYMAEQEGLSVVCIRIGAFEPLEKARTVSSLSFLDAYISPRDLQQLLELSIEKEGLRYAMLHGLSDNRFKRLDISDARDLLGYAPVDDMTELNPALRDLDLNQVVVEHNLSERGRSSGLRDEL